MFKYPQSVLYRFFCARGCIEWSTLRELKSTQTSPPLVSLGDDPEESREGRSVLEEGAERRRPSPKDFDPHHIARFCLRLLHLPSSFPLGTIILIPYILFKRRFAPKSEPRYFRASSWILLASSFPELITLSTYNPFANLASTRTMFEIPVSRKVLKKKKKLNNALHERKICQVLIYQCWMWKVKGSYEQVQYLHIYV